MRKQTTQLKMGKRSEHFTKEDIQTAKKHVERCSSSYIIKKIKVKMIRNTTHL
jgi:hypothetical protein